MGLNDTPRGERIHIAIFGRRNAGKSSLINALTGQELAVVSDVAGTTTDPVYKAMELLPLGPVVLIDTPGLDDEGKLGEQRIKKAREVLGKTDLAIVVIDGEANYGESEEAIIKELEAKRIPFMTVINKADEQRKNGAFPSLCERLPEAIPVSARTGEGIERLKKCLASHAPMENKGNRLVGDLLEPGDLVVLVVPIDSAAPKGRLILPQQQTIRDILEAGAVAVVTRENGLKETLSGLGRKPKLVITDSQAFEQVSGDTPEDILLTSFSILFARYKGELSELVRGAKAVSGLRDGDRVLIAEGCTHHRQCEDIGTVKIPKWLSACTGKQLCFETASGTEFPEDLSGYALVVHCGGCTLNEREMKMRIGRAVKQEIPIVNYGILIASLKGILERSLKPFGKENRT